MTRLYRLFTHNAIAGVNFLMPMKTIQWFALVLTVATAARAADQPASLNAVAHMPVKEVTVFKDGHAFVLHEGQMPTDADGGVTLDNLPVPVLGTFWPYSADPQTPLTSVTAGRRRVTVERTPMSVRELLEANLGAEVTLSEGSNRHHGRIVGVPARSSEELARTSPPDCDEQLPQKGSLFYFQTFDTLRVLDFNRVSDVAFKEPPKGRMASEEFRHLFKLKLDWAGRKPTAQVPVGMVYLQKGIRWIPNYKVVLDGKGEAVVKLQGTLINELTDLEDVTVHLVVGVPTFAFKDTADPIALGRLAAQLSRSFQPDAQTANAFANAIMSQQVMLRNDDSSRAPREDAASRPRDLGPDVATGGGAEDLFLFTIKHVTLRRGERVVLPVAEQKLKYQNVYALELPYAPPQEVRRGFNASQQTELAKLLGSPRVMHKVRLKNDTRQPLTTAPAIVMLGDRLLAQNLLPYTAPGGNGDLTITTAVDVQSQRRESESQRVPNAVQWATPSANGRVIAYTRIEMTGTVSVVNFKKEAVLVEVTRRLVGNPDKVTRDGAITQANLADEASILGAGDYPSWWSWYGWTDWWYHFNGMGRVDWKFTLKPGEKIELGYTWHYFWP